MRSPPCTLATFDKQMKSIDAKGIIDDPSAIGLTATSGGCTGIMAHNSAGTPPRPLGVNGLLSRKSDSIL